MAVIKRITSSGDVQFLQPNNMDELVAWMNNETGVLTGIEYKFYSYFTGLANNDSKEYLFVIPSSVNVGIRGMIIKTEAEAELRVWRGPTVSDNGTDVSNQIINENIASSNTSNCIAYEDPVYTSEGELIDIDYVPGSGNVTYLGGLLGDMMYISDITLLFQILNISGATMNRATIKMLFREW